MKKGQVTSLLAAVLSLTLLTSGCVPGLSPAGEKASASDISPVGEAISPSGISLTEKSDPSHSGNKCYFNKNGIQYVRLSSENIEASYEFYYGWYDPDENPRFKNLAPLYQDVAQEEIEDVKELGGVERDWEDFRQRLSQVRYDLRIHYSLEPEIDRIVRRLLVIDDVIPSDSELFYDNNIKWLHPEVLEQFIEENVDVEIIGNDPETDYSDLVSGLSWQVYSGGCFPDSDYSHGGHHHSETECGQHLFNVWLADLSGPVITIWDMKYVEEPGCGALLPMYQS